MGKGKEVIRGQPLCRLARAGSLTTLGYSIAWAITRSLTPCPSLLSLSASPNTHRAVSGHSIKHPCSKLQRVRWSTQVPDGSPGTTTGTGDGTREAVHIRGYRCRVSSIRFLPFHAVLSLDDAWPVVKSPFLCLSFPGFLLQEGRTCSTLPHRPLPPLRCAPLVV
jgi:hypothetical protein